MLNEPYEPKIVKLCISAKAFHILKSDESCFAKKRFKASNDKVGGTMVNTIIKNIDFSEDTGKIKNNDTVKFKCKLNKGTAERLSNYEIKKRGKSAFINKQLEKYADLPFFERERIFYKDVIEKIRCAKNDGSMVLVKTDGGKGVLIAPYAILTDEWSTYNYLIGTAFTAEGAFITNRRISFISGCEIKSPKSINPEYEPISDEKIRKRISESGIQFVSAKPIKIKVYLTKKGKDLYDHVIYLRPNIFCAPTESEPDVYTFFCTKKQAEYYFFKFGSDAKIVSPKSLRDRFKTKFEKALEKYSNSKQEN